MKFIHCSDVHLGKTLGGNRVRYLDYFKAFEFVVDRVVEMKVDCLVIAGDLFHHGSVDPGTLARTAEILEKLRAAGIPVAAIEGKSVVREVVVPGRLVNLVVK